MSARATRPKGRDREPLPATIPTTAHDIHVDLVVTAERVLECPRPRGHRARRLRWRERADEKVVSIPLLQRLR
ncbi:MAG TPA: hypothetical protein VKH17_02895 [Acidimicrobiia bacterium]|nr:hypothetical protein [Acidimicrobiia bacterium]